VIWHFYRDSRLHGVCNENSLAPMIRMLGLRLYRTSGDNSVLYDHDLERYKTYSLCSYVSVSLDSYISQISCHSHFPMHLSFSQHISISIFLVFCVPTFFAFFFSYKFRFCLFSYALFDKHGRQVPQEIVTKVGETFEKILEEVPHSFAHIYYLFNAFVQQYNAKLLLVNMADGESKR
jgi:hypothetical protein